MNVNDKRVSVCGICFLQTNNTDIQNVPGDKTIRLSGDWIEINISSGEWKEELKKLGEPVEQELKAVVTDTSFNNELKLRDLFSKDGLVLLKLTNGDKKVVGSDEFPIYVSMERSGEPAKITLSFKRSSPEPAKILGPFKR